MMNNLSEKAHRHQTLVIIDVML